MPDPVVLFFFLFFLSFFPSIFGSSSCELFTWARWNQIRIKMVILEQLATGLILFLGG